MLLEEEKMRIPVAQGLPWTTDEPEVKTSLIFLRSAPFSTIDKPSIEPELPYSSMNEQAHTWARKAKLLVFLP